VQRLLGGFLLFPPIVGHWARELGGYVVGCKSGTGCYLLRKGVVCGEIVGIECVMSNIESVDEKFGYVVLWQDGVWMPVG
jgi:hypothetical protein